VYFYINIFRERVNGQGTSIPGSVGDDRNGIAIQTGAHRQDVTGKERAIIPVK